MFKYLDRLLAVALCTSATAFFAEIANAEQVHNQERSFSFTLPSGYRDFPAGKNEPKVLYSYVRGEPNSASFAIFRLEALSGTIGREPLGHEGVERAARKSLRGTGFELTRIDYEKTTWREFTLELLVDRMSAGDRHWIALGVQIPLAKKAVQLGLVGPAAEEAQLRADMKSVLASFTGASSWLTDNERSERLGRNIGFVATIVITLSIVAFVRRRKLKRPGS
jgi:hypothetical protein